MKAHCVVEYLKLVELFNYEFTRGQVNSEWLLLPSIARISNPESCFNMGFCTWDEVEEFLLDEFKSQSLPYVSIKPEGDLSWMILAQHYSLATRLLDWTTNPLKSLFFAVENMDSNDGVVYFCSSIYFTSEKFVPNLSEIDEVTFFKSSHSNDRLVAQEGGFCAFPLPKGVLFEKFDPLILENSKNITLNKIIIDAVSKHSICNELNRLGINHRTIYPSMDGVSKSIMNGFKS